MSDTFNTRALRAIPLLLLVPIMLRAITFTIPMGDLIRSMRQRGLLSLHGVEAPLLTSFYNVPVLDTVLAEMTAAFALLQMYPVDPWAYWHALIFLTEYAGVYAVLLLESCRGSNEGSLFQL